MLGTQLKNIRAIGFDLDNTLYESTPEIQRKIRIRIYEKLSDYFKITFGNAMILFEREYKKLLLGSKAIISMAEFLETSAPNKDIVQDAIEESDILDLIEENSELNKMLKLLSKMKKIYLLTGSRRNLSLKKLEKLRIEKDVFKKIYTDEDGSKSSGEMYKKWMSDTGFFPEEHLYVGDNKKQDVDAPKKLGIKTCFLGDYQNADFCIDNILELEEVLAQAEE